MEMVPTLRPPRASPVAAQTRSCVEVPKHNVHSKQQTTLLGTDGLECSQWNYVTSESSSQAESGVFSPSEDDVYAWNDSLRTGHVQNELTKLSVECEQKTLCNLDKSWEQAAFSENLDFRPLSSTTGMEMVPTSRQPPSSPVAPLRTPNGPTEVCQRSDKDLCCSHLFNLLSD
ncbi:unnamed protein product [Dibothriocephalus latus]|uniref:Uncharacterized protein n=1 Tax=Dibothriocephalus latus TaxID=60516 RepID=A0A3P7LCC2_DIBLA|nr:unnamed protein product [Dibothriocephalus latus]